MKYCSKEGPLPPMSHYHFVAMHDGGRLNVGVRCVGSTTDTDV